MKQPIPVSYVHLANDVGSPLDQQATQTLLKMAWNDPYYKCPRCSYQTEDAALMISHLVEEINASLGSLEKMGVKATSAP
jgi:hypothetical protein